MLLVCFGMTSARAQLQEVGAGGPGPVKAQHLTVELVSLAPGVAPGGTTTLGLVITLEEKWHVYWVNAGDSGQPPTIKWTLRPGSPLGRLQFVPPQQLPLGPLMDFGYEDEVAFPVSVSVKPSVKPGMAHLDAKVSWLVCREVCIPGRAHLGIDLNVTPGATPGPLVGALGEAIKHLPKPLPDGMTASVLGGKNEFVLTLKTGNKEEDAEFYPFDPDQIANAAEQQEESLPDGIRLRIQRSPDLTKLPETLHGLIKLSDTEAYDVTAPVPAGELPGSTPAAQVKGAAGSTTALGAIGLAFWAASS